MRKGHRRQLETDCLGKSQPSCKHWHQLSSTWLGDVLRPTLSRTLGTRHRAAIGITEETDCLSIVVSEETGRISVAAFGEIASGIPLAELVHRIHVHFGMQRLSDVETGEAPAREQGELVEERRSVEGVNRS